MNYKNMVNKMRLNVTSEYGKLKKVLMASVETFHIHKPINKTQEFYYKNDPPQLNRLIEQQNSFIKVLKDYGVDVIFAEKRMDCTNQINTRDVGFVVGNSFIVSPMKEKERSNEHYALNTLIQSFDSECVVLCPQTGVIEGGDIIINGKQIFVGISQRTNQAGVMWLNAQFGDKFDIIPIFLKDNFLHLDVVFNILSCQTALVYRAGIMEESLIQISKYFPSIIFTDESEQINLPTNVFSIDESTVVADLRNKKTNLKIQAEGKTLIELDFSEISKIGGSFRCSTCPLIRV